ncbi:MAG: HlyD family type I secretion periplasmic adaptor subunit [Rhodospirillaceae bacterium]|jgi:membrane fusion protein, adhesin transport system|nr:HlyD family type I secretion periplasmic adaptor subunit [Rhodospirillaceae bacterium]
MSEQAVDTMDTTEPPRKVRRGDRQTRFLAQSVVLEEAGSSGLIRIAMVTIVVVICAFLVWSAVTNVDEVAIASGEVVPTGQVQSIQHLEGGLIAEILISEGEIVEKEQVLVRLDPSAAAAELNQMKARRAGLELQRERLRALGTADEPDFSLVGPEYRQLIDDQMSIYQSAVDAADNRRKVVVAQIEQRKQEMALLDEREDTLSRTSDLRLEEFEMREDLFRRGLTTRISYLDAKRALNDTRGELANLIVERQQTRESLIEQETRLEEIDTDAREQALAEMGAVTNELAQVNETLSRLFDRERRLEIVSPVRGIVKGLQIHTVGGVAPPGAVILEVVPLDKELVVETRITTRDVGHVRVGQPVTLKVTTFDFARYGGISGELRDVSASTFIDEATGDPYYKGIVAMDRGYVGFDPEKNRVMPGMTVQADIKTGRKTLLEYLMKPVVSSVKTAFRER